MVVPTPLFGSVRGQDSCVLGAEFVWKHRKCGPPPAATMALSRNIRFVTAAVPDLDQEVAHAPSIAEVRRRPRPRVRRARVLAGGRRGADAHAEDRGRPPRPAGRLELLDRHADGTARRRKPPRGSSGSRSAARRTSRNARTRRWARVSATRSASGSSTGTR